MISPMRRLERAVSDGNHVLEIIQSCDCCRVAFSEPDGPYIMPMNFGIESSQEGQMALCFHRASSGKKVELMQKNPCVGFEMDTGHVLVPGMQACSCPFLYQSVIGKGKIEAISNSEEKKHVGGGGFYPWSAGCSPGKGIWGISRWLRPDRL